MLNDMQGPGNIILSMGEPRLKIDRLAVRYIAPKSLVIEVLEDWIRQTTQRKLRRKTGSVMTITSTL